MLRDAAGLQKPVSAAGFATVFDAGRGYPRAHALKAGARRMELLKRISRPLAPFP